MSLNEAELTHIIHKAEDTCVESGGRLTVKRKNILVALLSADMPQLPTITERRLAKQFQLCPCIAC